MNPDNHREQQQRLIEDGLQACHQQDFERAEALINAAISLGDVGWLPTAHYNLGFVSAQQGKLGDAMRHYEHALALNPQYEKALVNYGCLLLNSGYYLPALESFEKAVSINPHAVRARFNQALALNKLQRHQEALPILQALSNLDPSSGIVDDFDDAYFLLFSELGYTLVELGRYCDAVNPLLTAYKLNAHVYAVCCNLGICYDHAGEYDEALSLFEQAIQLSATPFKAYQSKGCTLMKVGKPKEALVLFKLAHELEPNHYQPYYNMACAHAVLREKALMLTMLKLAIQTAPPFIDVKAMTRKDTDFTEFLRDQDLLEMLHP